MWWWILVSLVGLGLVPAWSQAQEPCPPQVTVLTMFELQWSPPSPALPDLTLQDFVLERQRDTEAWQLLATLDARMSTWLDGPLEPGHTYRYRHAARFRLPDSTLVTSRWSAGGTPPPCVSVIDVPPPGPLTGHPVAP